MVGSNFQEINLGAIGIGFHQAVHPGRPESKARSEDWKIYKPVWDLATCLNCRHDDGNRLISLPGRLDPLEHNASNNSDESSGQGNPSHHQKLGKCLSQNRDRDSVSISN